MFKRMMLALAFTMCVFVPVTRADTEHTATTVVESVDHHPAGEGGHEKPPLLPPLTGDKARETYYSALWVLIIFVVMLAILYPTAWKNVLAGLKKREERIRGDIAAAEAANAKAQAAMREYQNQLAQAESKVRDLLSQAGADAEKLAAGVKVRAQQEAEEIKERATREIETSKNNALAEIYAQVATLSTSIAEKILRRSLNAEDQKDLVAQSLEQMQSAAKN